MIWRWRQLPAKSGVFAGAGSIADNTTHMDEQTGLPVFLSDIAVFYGLEYPRGRARQRGY